MPTIPDHVLRSVMILVLPAAGALRVPEPACAQDAAPAAEAPLAPSDLRSEYLVDPLGLDARKPRFSWEVSDPRRGAVQSAYEIVVTESPPLSPGNVLWESGKVASRETCQIEYGGPPLASFCRYAWKVRTYDGAGRASPWSNPAMFGTAALDPSQWKAQWIGDATPPPRSIPARNGFHTEFADKEDVQKWIQFDLGKEVAFDTIQLHPAKPHDAPEKARDPGFLFPLRLKVWGSDDPRFEKRFQKIFDETLRDIPNPGTGQLVLKATETRYSLRYIRIGFTKMARLEGRGFAVALAEAEILDQGKVVSGKAVLSASDSIETGEWALANLIDGDLVSHGPQGFDPLPAPILRKEFVLGAPAARATLFASALGIYDVRINGQRVGEDQLSPGWTDYGVRVPFLAYDVTSLLRPGENAIVTQLADGWYAGRLGLSWLMPGGAPRGIYGRKPRFLAQLEIERPEGSGAPAREAVVTDGTWRSTTTGPVREADLLDGVVYDARAAIASVDEVQFDDKAWTPVEVSADLHPELDAIACEPVKILQVLKPVGLKEPKPGVYVFDLGQNMVGWCRLKLRAPAGTEIRLRHAEVAEPDGSIYTENLRSATQTDRYVCSGSDGEEFEPRFTVHGFRYVEVTGLPRKPDLSDLRGCVVGNGARYAGTFRASDPMLDKLWSNIHWTLRGNLLTVPTDCPQRDERLGWTGDIAAFAQTGAFQRELAGVFGKWLQDLRDAQADDGRYPDFAPHPYGRNARNTGTPAWGDAGVIVPWVAWLNYGDRRLVETHLDSMLRWLERIRSKNPDLVWRHDRGSDYGDWLNGDTLVREGWPKTGGSTPGEVLATAFFANSARLVARMASAVGRDQDAQRCRELFQGIRTAFQKAFVDENGRIQGDSQGACALALAFDLLDEAQQERALERLVGNIERDYGGHLSTGFTSTLPALMELSKRGKVELATKLALDHRFPSWGYAIDNGATTLWERWDGFVKERGLQDAGMNSFNHYAFGAIGEWMVRVLAGIEPDEEHPGWSHFSVHPRAGSGIGWVRVERATIRGKLSCSWARGDGGFELELAIPANTSATVTVPAKDAAGLEEGGRPIREAAPHVEVVSVKDGEAVLEVRAGRYKFKSRT